MGGRIHGHTGVIQVQLPTVEFGVDHGSGLPWAKPTVPCL
jgi:hypothetical protein